MKIFELSVVDSKSPNWEASTYKGKVIVRANDEAEARMLATSSFGTAVERRGSETIINPWNQGSIVSCAHIEVSDYKNEGDATILFPEQNEVT